MADSAGRRHANLARHRGLGRAARAQPYLSLTTAGRAYRWLGVPEAIGVNVTESWRLVPEQSTAAIVVPNPASVYFAVRE